ncbi:MAG TPA: 50S ribosomal protein L24 [Phycisphaerae bacterium]|nr:50S ribosomal protein L24 [Phycisphaerae bacterium]HOI54058.1 50S ribosomal protein L24 [Phycisphaerae bacterium]
MRIRKGDLVEIIAGEDASQGATRRRMATVLQVMPKQGKVLVEGVNVVSKHVRPSRKNPQGGRLDIEAPIDMSNVMPVCSKCNQGVRVGYRIGEDGVKVRYCKKCDAVLSKVSKQK